MDDQNKLRSAAGLRKFVEANPEGVAFLRFERGGLKQSKTSDWDIAVRDCKAAMSACESLFGQAWVRIPRTYVVQHFYEWGQCDLLPAFEWNGIQYLDSEKFWAEVKVHEDGLPRPAFGHDAFIAWMTGLLWGRRFNSKYRDFIKKAARQDGERFRECLDDAFGQKLGQELYRIAERGDAGVATHWVSRMRRRLFIREVCSAPRKTIAKIYRHWRCEWKFHRRLALPWIGLLGPDGSGKSTVLNNVQERLKYSRLKLRIVHWLPMLSLYSKQGGGIVTDPHAQPPKSAILSILQLVKILVHWWWASFRYLFHLRAKKEIILSDRFYLDLLADSKRYRFGANLGIARLVFKLLPKPDKLIVLLTEPDKILSRKQEVTEQELVKQLKRYEEIANEYGDEDTVVDCGRAPAEVAEKVLQVVLSALRSRSR